MTASSEILSPIASALQKYRIPLLLWVCLACYTVASAAPTYYYKQIGAQEGLSQPSITSIISDYKGLLWIGTRFGLNLYQNGHLQCYKDISGKSSSIQGNYIYLLAQDSRNTLWVSTERGISTYNRNYDVFTLRKGNAAFSAVEWNRKMYFGSRGTLLRFDPQTNRFSEIIIEPNHHIINKLVPVSSHEMLIVSKTAGIYCYDAATSRVKHLDIPMLQGQVLMDACRTSDGKIYLSVYRKGLYVLDSTGRVLNVYSRSNSGLTHDVILTLLNCDSRLWLGTDGGGICIFDPATKRIFPISELPGYERDRIPTNSITNLYRDQQHNMWIGSVRLGLFGMKETHIKTYHSVAFNAREGLSDNTVISLYESPDRMLWIGTDGGGVNKYNPFSDTFTHYPTTRTDKVSSLTQFKQNSLLVSLYCKGLFVFDTQSGSCTPFTIIDKQTNDFECFSGCSPMVYKVADNKIYIFSERAYIYNTATDKFEHLNMQGNFPISEMILFYNKGHISYSYSSNGIYRLDSRTNTIRCLYLAKSGGINTAAYSCGNIWIGTNHGLECYDLDKGKIFRINTQLFFRITQLKEGSQNRLWIAADNLLFCYFVNEGRFEIIDESDGFSPNEIVASCFVTNNPSNIYLGGTQGLVKIDNDIRVYQRSEPRLSLFEILLNGKKMNFSSDKDKISIPWGYSSFEITVNLEGNDPFRKTMYRYTITGTLNTVVETYDNKLSLPTLQPGNYTVSASYLQKDGKWSQALKILKIRVTPPWYKNGWFYLFAIIVITALILYIIRRLRLSNREKLERSLLKQREINDSERIQFLVNINHELRTPLTLIYSPLKRILGECLTETQLPVLQERLKATFKQVCRMKDIINMVLDFDRMKSSGEALRKMPYDLPKWVTSIGEDFKDEMANSGITLKYRFDDSIGIVWFDKWKCQIILSNMLMNALKYNPKDSTVTISITASEGDMVRVTVSDEGPGLNNITAEKLFTRFGQGTLDANGTGIGMSYAKKLITLHGGNIGAYNNPGHKGASFYFELPLLSDTTTGKTIEKDLGDENAALLPADLKNLKENEFSKKTIIIVEDNGELRDFLVSELSPLFKKVLAAANGEDALSTIKSAIPDLILSDIMMPKMDGYELCRAVKGNITISHIPIILLTAKSDAESQLTGYKLGADYYISKPFDNDLLLAIIGNVLRARERIKQVYKDIAPAPSPIDTTFTLADEQFLLKFNNIILSNLPNKELDISYIISEMAMSRTSLYDKVKAITGLGVNEYINRLKIDEACTMLRNPSLSITEIADALGYSSQRYFSSCFKTSMKMSPREYRNANTSQAPADK